MIDKNLAKKKSLNFIEKYPSLSDIQIRVGTKNEFFGAKANQVGEFSGAFYPKSKIVLVNTDDIESNSGLEKTLRHELIGHAGINTTSPEEKKELLTAITNSDDPKIKELKNKVDWLYPNSTKLEQAEEVFAKISETPQQITSPRAKINSDNISYKELSNIVGLIEKGLMEGTRVQKTFPESDQSQFQKTTVKEPYYETVAKKIIEQLEQGTAPWQKPWKEGVGLMPHNPTTNARYKGINSIYLAAQGREDPRWMTYKQAQSIKAQVKKGEKGTRIEYYKFDEEKIKRDENNKPVLDGNGNKIKVKVKLDRPKVFSASVFNAEQIEGLPKREVTKITRRAMLPHEILGLLSP